eukprot:TRINITY_DN15578_c0_g1_i1.p1 TRINITY_DN15578_c0_g1~~TRINITY_DN15578_c0_g1_i1.p1  ORF type:complete len:311 (+),score=35.43 TRINITY_DN15578_c0_g1_i1:76-1008(+)
MRIGVDIGGVVIEKNQAVSHSEKEDTVIGDTIVLVEGAIDCLRQLVDDGHMVAFVSYCGERREEQTRLAFKSTRFLQQIGLSESCLHFTRSREDKGPVCQKLALDVMVDDTFKVLTYVTPFVQHPIWFRGSQHPVYHSCANWPAVVTHITALATVPVPSMNIGIEMTGVVLQQGGAKLVEGVIDGLAQLIAQGHRVSLITTGDAKVQDSVRCVLAETDLLASTGLAQERVLFCRNPKSTATCCQSLHLDMMVQATYNTMRSLEAIVPRDKLVWFQGSHSQRYQCCSNWKQLVIDVRAFAMKRPAAAAPAS